MDGLLCGLMLGPGVSVIVNSLGFSLSSAVASSEKHGCNGICRCILPGFLYVV